MAFSLWPQWSLWFNPTSEAVVAGKKSTPAFEYSKIMHSKFQIPDF